MQYWKWNALEGECKGSEYTFMSIDHLMVRMNILPWMRSQSYPLRCGFLGNIFDGNDTGCKASITRRWTWPCSEGMFTWQHLMWRFVWEVNTLFSTYTTLSMQHRMYRCHLYSDWWWVDIHVLFCRYTDFLTANQQNQLHAIYRETYDTNNFMSGT